jgi:hypothetical protein
MTSQTFRAAGQFVILPRVPLFIQVLYAPIIVIYFVKCCSSLQQISEASHIHAHYGALSNYCVTLCRFLSTLMWQVPFSVCTVEYRTVHLHFLSVCILLSTVSGKNESYGGKQSVKKWSIAWQCDDADFSGNCGYRTGGYMTATIKWGSQMTWCQ